MEPTLVIHLEGGVVSQVVSTIPFPPGWDICVVDQDDDSTERFRASAYEVECNPAEVEALLELADEPE